MKDVPKGAGLAEMGGIIRRPLPEPKKPKSLAHDDHGHGGHGHDDHHGGGHH
jgi:NADH-quinone oxidoreductase subunit J